MILDILFLGSIAVMIGTMIIGVIEYIFLSTLITLAVMAFWLEKDDEFSYIKNYKKNRTFRKKKKVELSDSIKCVHTKKDCEECFSQTGCQLKEKNIIENEQEV